MADATPGRDTRRRGRPPVERDLGRFAVERTLDPATPRLTWRPTDGDDPVAVATAYLQRRLLEAASAATDGDRRRVERDVDRPRDVLKAVWDGSESIQLRDAVALALTYGMPLQDSPDPGALLPEEFRPWLVRADGRAPVLRRPGTVDWARVAEHVCRRVAVDDAAGLGRFLRPSALLAAAAAALASCGLAPDLADPDPDEPDRRLVYSVGAGLAVAVSLLADEPATTTEGVGALIRAAAGLRAGEAIIVVARPRAWSRVVTAWTELRGAASGNPVMLPATTAHAAGVPAVDGEIPEDVPLRLAGTAHEGGTTTAVLVFDK